MPQCHDSYPPLTAASSPAPVATGAQCHDLYSEDESRPAHECRIFVDDACPGPVRIVRVIGRLDWSTAREFHDLIEAECGDEPVAVDLTLAHLDSAGTGILLSAVAAAHRRRQPIALVVADPVETDVLAMLQVDAVATIVNSLPAARRRLEDALRDAPTR